MKKEHLFDYYKPTASGCWEWSRGRLKSGYGAAYVDGRQQVAHRVAYELVRGQIPKGMYVCHRCDNPPCINPDHLWLGSHKENMHDAIKKGRASKPPVHKGGDHWRLKFPHMVEHGEDNPNAIMTDESVIGLRRDYVAGVPLDVLFSKYDVTRNTIHEYTSGRRWKHLLGVDGSPTLEELKAECARRRRNSARLNQEKADEIRKRLAAGEQGKDLAVEYGVHKATISDIRQNKIWR